MSDRGARRRKRGVDAPPAERAALLAEFQRRAEDYQTLSLMRHIPARLSGSADAMTAATGLGDDEVAHRLLRALAATHRRVAGAFGVNQDTAKQRFEFASQARLINAEYQKNDDHHGEPECDREARSEDDAGDYGQWAHGCGRSIEPRQRHDGRSLSER